MTSGSGRTLPLTKALVEAHGGSLELESTLGSGTTVRVILRTAATQAAQEPHGLADQAPELPQKSRPQPLV